MRYNSGFIGVDKTPTATNQQGIHTATNQFLLKKLGFWTDPPAIISSDTYFNYTTLLLPGDGTNGAQNNTFLDSSSNNFSITRNGNTTQGTFSPFSVSAGYWSNFFNAANSDVFSLGTVFLNSISSSTATFTMEAWVYLNSFGVSATSFYNRTILAKGQIYLNFGIDQNGKVMLYHYDGSTRTNASTNAISLNTWTHVAVVVNGSGTITFYINGVANGTATWYGHTGTDQTARLGGTQDTNGGANNYWNGYISNVRTTSTQVYTSAFTPSTTPLTAISGTTFLSCQSNRFVDNSSNGYTLTVAAGSPSVQAFSPFLPTAAYSAATNGGSGYFDGNSDYVDAGSNAAWRFTSTTSFTVEMWLYVTANNKGVVSAYAGSGGWVIGIGTDSGTGTFNVFDGVAWQAGYGPDIRNQWAHCVFTSDAGSAALFVNGSRTRTWTLPAGIDPGSNANLYVGSYTLAGSPFYVGNISGFRIVKGSYVYNPASSTLTVPTSPPTNITNTSILLNFTNAGIIDNTAKNDLQTVGNAQISTSVSKFGNGSMYFDGTGDYLVGRNSNLLQLASGPFTIEFWYLTNTLTPPNFGYACIVGMQQVSGAGGWGVWQLNQTISFFIDGGSSSYVTGNVLTSTGVWYHVAVTRDSSNNMKTFINGVQQGSQSSVSFSNNASQPLTVGGINNATGWNESYYVNGYIQDLRITKGIARYTSSFTAPTAALPLQ